jgi:hypothetical protein
VEILLGGAIVSLFALLGDVLQPKRFAGLFSVGAVGRFGHACSASLLLTRHFRA